MTRGSGEGGWLRHRVLDEEAGRTVESIVTGPLGISRRMIQRLTRAKGITHNSRPAYLKRPVRGGDVIGVRVPRNETPTLPPVPMELSVLYEDEDVLVVDKPAGLLVHPTSPRQVRTLAHGVAHHLERSGIRAKVRPIHRLDHDTSGAVLFAKSASAQHRLDLQLAAGDVMRAYIAVVEGEMREDEGVIDHPIGRSRQDPRLRAVRPNGKPARTHFTVLERLSGGTLVRALLETGRTHQLRVHFAFIGHPVIGDQDYGARPEPRIRRVALHAERLRFMRVGTGEPIEVTAPIPADLAGLIDGLRIAE